MHCGTALGALGEVEDNADTGEEGPRGAQTPPQPAYVHDGRIIRRVSWADLERCESRITPPRQFAHVKMGGGAHGPETGVEQFPARDSGVALWKAGFWVRWLETHHPPTRELFPPRPPFSSKMDRSISPE
jgi:hypothetical protein